MYTGYRTGGGGGVDPPPPPPPGTWVYSISHVTRGLRLIYCYPPLGPSYLIKYVYTYGKGDMKTK